MRKNIFFVIVVCFVPASGGPAAWSAEPTYTDKEREHWSLQPRRAIVAPSFEAPTDARQVSGGIDAFVLQKLRAVKLDFAPGAERVTLARRAYFDLTGLPPTPDDIHEFLADHAPDAFDRLIDRLLASPRYGEQWGQHWLDVIRFAETEGFEYDRYRPGAWRFRDYVIASLNDDKPYDQFVREQLAGDELQPVDDRQRQELQVAAGFHRLGPVRRNAGNAEVAFSRNEVLTEMTDIIGAAFLGLTVGCARCHDHKFDPIRQRDYYQLQAFLATTQEHDLTLATPEQRAQWQKETDRIKAAISDLNKMLTQVDLATEEKLLLEIEKQESQLPPDLPTISTVRRVADDRSQIHILDRGEENRPGELVQQRVLGVLRSHDAPLTPAEQQSPKTALARWLTDPNHPLTARVIVNRVWQYHFGRGIVDTANDFGVNGSAPSHPELLDWLANEFVAGDWSIKHLHRRIMTSSTYQQSSNPQSAIRNSQSIDPDNRWLWHFPRRRLTAQEIRDAMLAISDQINPAMGGPSVMIPVDEKLIELLYNPSQWQIANDPREFNRRSVYLIAKRNLKLPFMEVFDEPDRQCSCAKRAASTHAPQSLEMLNGQLSNELAKAFAERLSRDANMTDDQLVRLAFIHATGRPPTAVQLAASREFLKHAPVKEFALAMFNLNRFLYVD